jgi:amino acid adenylation domain-containing protein
MTVLAAWSVVLSRLSGQDDVVIGTPTANRGHHEIESLIGFFVNTLALRVDLSGKPTMRELLERVRQRTLDAYGHQDLPFEQVVEIVKPPRSMNHTPLFQVMFVWQNNEASELHLDGVQATSFGLHYDAVKFDLELGFTESDEKIVGSLRYATSLFDHATIEKHVGYLTTVLREMTSDVNQSISAPVLLSSDERTLLLETWNTTQEDYPTDVCLHQKFEQQVLRTPEATAIVCEEKSMTYSELNARANSLAHHLIQLGVQPETLVGICVERSLGMIVGVLAILKAGGAYLPLDPAFASDRLRDILSDASPSIVLADTTGTAAIQGLDLSRFTMIDPNSSFGGPAANPQISQLTSRNLAYVIYTSGTTGKPKGVMLEHQGVLNLIQTRQSFAGVDSRSRLSQFFSFNFDSSVSEIFPALCLGSTLHILRDTVRLDLHRLWEYLEKHSITHVVITPAVLQDSEGLPPLSTPTTFIIAGEALPAALVRKMRDLLPHCTIINEYGPTETTVAATAWKFTTNLHTDIVPIGRPYANKRLYILDTHGNPVPHGAVGELFVGGVGVARGYLNRPELTAERFLQDPFAGDAEARMYKTGDLVRYLPDGNVVFLGRNDHQIKIRGFRIELGEIEARLHEHPLLAEAAVFAIGEGANKRLVAYVIAKPDDQVSEDEDQDKGE